MSDKRKQRRSRISGDLRIHWNDDAGNYFDLKGMWCDLSEIGGGLHVKRPIKPGTTVKIDSPWLLQSGMAVVRGCELDGGRFRLGLEFLPGTKGQLIEGQEGAAGITSRPAHEAPSDSSTGHPPRTCILCGLDGHSRGAYLELKIGFEPGTTAQHQSWLAHEPCLKRLREEVWYSVSFLRCPRCCAEIEIAVTDFGEAPAPRRCLRCGCPPEAIEAGWRKLAHPCVICSLPVYELAHSVWPGPAGPPLPHPTHALCARALGLNR